MTPDKKITCNDRLDVKCWPWLKNIIYFHIKKNNKKIGGWVRQACIEKLEREDPNLLNDNNPITK